MFWRKGLEIGRMLKAEHVQLRRGDLLLTFGTKTLAGNNLVQNAKLAT